MNNNTPKIKITDVELDEEKTYSKRALRLFPKRNQNNKKEAKNGKFQDAKIQIIIDNVNDEENVVIDHCVSYSDPL